MFSTTYNVCHVVFISLLLHIYYVLRCIVLTLKVYTGIYSRYHILIQKIWTQYLHIRLSGEVMVAWLVTVQKKGEGVSFMAVSYRGKLKCSFPSGQRVLWFTLLLLPRTHGLLSVSYYVAYTGSVDGGACQLSTVKQPKWSQAIL